MEAAKKGYCNRSNNSNYVNKLGVNSFNRIESGIRLFPNPINEVLTIEFDKKDIYQIRVYNLLGQIIYQIEVDSNTNINFEDFSKGMYLISISNSQFEHFITKILKE